jgi:RNA polymerase sigma-70 factor (ECF subfamily)
MDNARSLAQLDARRGELVSLLENASFDDRSSLKRLYEYTSAKLYGICLRLLRDEAEAQEVLQEVYLTAWRKAASFDASRASPITWLATIARNRSIDRLRARQVPTEDLGVAADIPDDSPSSLQLLETAEDASRLHHCLEELESRARTAIRAAFFDGATYPELADREGVPLPTMKSWIRRGLISLRGCLER